MKPFVRVQYGEEISDHEARLDAYRSVIPGQLPDDYGATLLWLRRTTGLEDNQIRSVKLPSPREQGAPVYVGANPELCMLYGLQAGHANVFRELTALAARLPAGLIPIADSSGGSVICLDVSDRGNGRVYHWFDLGDPGKPDRDGRPGWDNTFLVAESFTDLCRRLRPAGRPAAPGALTGHDRLDQRTALQALDASDNPGVRAAGSARAYIEANGLLVHHSGDHEIQLVPRALVRAMPQVRRASPSRQRRGRSV